MRPTHLVVLATLACMTAAAPAYATPPDPTTMATDDGPPAPDIGTDVDNATVLALGQVFVSEANWRRTPDPEAIAEVLRSRHDARGDATMLDTIRAYAPRATGVRPSSLIRMQWISTLRLDAGEPDGWRILNRHRSLRGDLPLPWSNFTERWRGRLALARNILEDEPDACPGAIDHWGAQSLDRTGLGWLEIRCGAPGSPATVNRFWRLPRG